MPDLHLTEGRCTGVPKIRNAMEANDSPPPIFETDDNHSFFLVTLPIHPEATRKITTKKKSVSLKDETHQLTKETHQLTETRQNEDFLEKQELPKELKLKIDSLRRRPKNEEIKSIIYTLCSWKPLTAQQIAEFLNRKDKKHLVRQYLTPLVKDSLLKYVYPERGNSPNQAYRAVF